MVQIQISITVGLQVVVDFCVTVPVFGVHMCCFTNVREDFDWDIIYFIAIRFITYSNKVSGSW